MPKAKPQRFRRKWEYLITWEEADLINWSELSMKEIYRWLYN